MAHDVELYNLESAPDTGKTIKSINVDERTTTCGTFGKMRS